MSNSLKSLVINSLIKNIFQRTKCGDNDNRNRDTDVTNQHFTTKIYLHFWGASYTHMLPFHEIKNP